MPRRRLASLALLTLALILSGNAAAQQQPMTPAAWRADLRFAVDSFLPRDRSFSDAARARFRAAVAALADSADGETDEEMIAGLARAVAFSGNAHTRLYLLRNRSELRRLPVRVWWFDDGLFVVRAQPGYEALLGARVTRICGHAVDQVRRAVRPLYAGNDSWAAYIAGYTMTSPEVLSGLHLCPRGAAPVIRYVARDGRRGERALEPLPLRRSDQPTEAWWDLSPLHPGVQGPWASALPADTAALPLYLRDPLHPYWMRYLAGERTLYIQHNRAVQMESEPMAAFTERVLSTLQSHPVRKIVVDERFNTGGNLEIAQPLMRSLASTARERGVALYVITGRVTFSAGLSAVAQLREWGRATLVGEPAGEGLDDFWAEGGNLRMPNSRLTLHFADRVHSYALRKAHPRSPFTALELHADRVTPEVRVGLTWREYVAGRDPALEAILRR
ncbi:MAG TPA: hypothetical protein VFJ16_29135 [Longimicrobium sp.]|nr:hypothetical protein [Longimicrobium sp.]